MNPEIEDCQACGGTGDNPDGEACAACFGSGEVVPIVLPLIEFRWLLHERRRRERLRPDYASDISERLCLDAVCIAQHAFRCDPWQVPVQTLTEREYYNLSAFLAKSLLEFAKRKILKPVVVEVEEVAR